MKKFPYDYQALCNAFVNQSYQSATTADDRMSFYGTTLYSYSSKLAIIDLTANLILIDAHISSYSSTSARHTSELLFVRQHYKAVYLHDLSNPNISWIYLTHLIDKFTKARKPHTKQQYARAAIRSYKEQLLLADYLKIDKRTTIYREHKYYLAQLIKLKLL